MPHWSAAILMRHDVINERLTSPGLPMDDTAAAADRRIARRTTLPRERAAGLPHPRIHNSPQYLTLTTRSVGVETSKEERRAGSLARSSRQIAVLQNYDAIGSGCGATRLDGRHAFPWKTGESERTQSRIAISRTLRQCHEWAEIRRFHANFKTCPCSRPIQCATPRSKGGEGNKHRPGQVVGDKIRNKMISALNEYLKWDVQFRGREQNLKLQLTESITRWSNLAECLRGRGRANI